MTNTLAQTAHSILQKTALQASDIAGVPIRDLIIRELGEAHGLMIAFLEDDAFNQGIEKELVFFRDHAAHFRDLLIEDHKKLIAFKGGEEPVYKAAAVFCHDLANFVRSIAMAPEWEELYAMMMKRLDDWAFILSKYPDDKIIFN